MRVPMLLNMDKSTNEEMVDLFRTRKGTMGSKMVIDKINDVKMNFGSKVTLRKNCKEKIGF